MREASKRRTATDTDSCAFFLLNQSNADEGMTEANIYKMNIYKKSFIFESNFFEEYQDGKCISRGSCNTTVIAKVMDKESIGMTLRGVIPVRINTRFRLPILGEQCGDVLSDRIQYGRIPDSMSWQDSNEPVVCNIFDSMTCIRFAMMSPLRIVEFNGRFTKISDLSNKTPVAEGINMGRISPWSKDYLKALYHKIDTYCKLATLYALKTEGQQVAMETMAAYNMFKYPIVYIYVHYHFGKFEDLGMKDADISSYITMYMLMVKDFTQGMIDEMLGQEILGQTVFDFDKKNEIAPALIEICREVIYIEDNF